MTDNEKLEKIKRLSQDVIRAIDGNLWNMANTRSYYELKELVTERPRPLPTPAPKPKFDEEELEC